MATPIPELTMSQPSPGAALPPRGIRSRTQSMSSDRPSTIALSLMSPPLSVSPEAAFIAASAASQIVTNDHDSHAETWYDQHGIEPAGETALVSQEALLLVNNFLDQLLFNFLSISRATTLSALRPAVAEVLKPKLAKDAVNNADEELREYLGEGDEDDFVQPQGGNPSRDWDLELVWKRTRLRCMVYSSLGDMEEEDEDLHMEQENLEIGADEQTSALISPAVAIFLTSVLEYMGELTLTVAGQAAYHRLRTKFQKEIKDGSKSPSDISERIVVEDQDMERVALDRTLGRLWRGWKKRIRSPTFDMSGRPFSRASMGHLRRDSSLTEMNRTPMHSDGEKDAKKAATEAGTKDLAPSDIALPMGNNDVDEIEVPGLAFYSDDEDEGDEEDDTASGNRPKSLLILPFGATTGLPTPILSQPNTPDFAGRKRSNSLPTPGTSPYRPVIKRPKDSATAETSAVIEEQAAKGDQAIDETKPVEQSTPAEEPTIQTSASKRLSKIVTDPSTAAAFRNRSRRGTGEEGDGKVGYEKAEILTSARVSVSGSASPALSDSGGPFSMKRSNSVHSARIIDVTGPKSPSGSRSPSVDNTDRVRPVSVTLSAHSSNQSYKSSPEEPPMPKSWGTLPHQVVTGSKSRSPVDRMRGSISNAATISESDEETEHDFSKDQNTGKNATFQSSPLIQSIPESPPAQRKRPQPLIGLPAQPRPSPHRKTSSGTKVTILRAPSAPSPLPEDRPAEISRKTGSNGNWQGSHDKTPTSPTHSIGMVSIERSKTKDDEEEAGVSSSAPRPIHTSGSSASSGTSRLKAVRTSEENASRSENVARNFEELIQSNQTITYTLTPENMRDMDHKRSLDQPLASKASWKTDDARNHNRSRSSSATTEVKSYHRATSHSDDKTKGGLHSPVTSSAKSARSLTAAREARVPGESTADFADFIKSTGPAGGQNRPSPLRSNPPGASPAHVNASPSDARRVSSASTRNRYMPREAVAEGRAGNSDLIDFIRQGPPGPSNNRIPRTVAPFRDTLDSDEMSGAVGGKAVDANIPDIRYSQASTHVTDTSMPSIHSSVNSHTALLKNKGGSTPASKMFDDEEMMPKRKTRRVKDPYAIDFSDEDDDDDFISTPKPPVKKEESLAEFLKNYDPPPEPVTQPIAHKMPKKKASAPSLIGRFTRSSSNSNSSSHPHSPVVGSARSLSSRNGAKGHIPINVNVPSGYDKYGQIEKPAARPSVPAMGGSMGRVPMKRFEPREAVSDVSRTSDLAAFLRNSEPPPEPIAAPPPRQEEASTLSKMFSRRKKSSMA
ncbi:hypothetical protein QQZ08_008973 [Neonectria magnoliae]|uniref:Flo11 n=1 Tax=Neonectria magnoliae TaxID=2732573 RepID=A0ABR1HS18_9HYPO